MAGGITSPEMTTQNERLRQPLDLVLGESTDKSLLNLTAITSSIVCEDSTTSLSQESENIGDAAIVAATTTTETNGTRSTRDMLKEISALAIPALGSMLLDPIMSIVDTACVGQVSTLQLASMAPCTSIFQFLFISFFFLSAATTNLIAAKPVESTHNEKQAQQVTNFHENVVSYASSLAVVLGVLLTTILFKFSDPLLTLAGCADPGMLQAARSYLRIRALGMPFLFLATVLQGAYLGKHDAWTPLRVFAAAGVLNLIGDVWLSTKLGGVVGVAIATLVSQASAALYFAWKSSRRNVDISTNKGVRLRLGLRPASPEIVKTFGNVAVSLFLRSMGIMTAFSAMTKTAAGMGAIALAAHQVTLQVWWMLSYIPEPMSLAAQTLIARDMKKPDNAQHLSTLAKVLYGMAGTLGATVATATLVALTAPMIASTLVADVSVQAIMTKLAPLAFCAQISAALASLSDGICIGSGSFGHLPGVMIGSTLAAMAAMTGGSVSSVWMSLNLFYITRVVGHVVFSKRLRQLLFLGAPRPNAGRVMQPA
jgi:putative MATE family efflux protein